MSSPLASTVVHTTVAGINGSDTYTVTFDPTSSYVVRQPRSVPERSAWRFPYQEGYYSSLNIGVPQAVISASLTTYLNHTQFRPASEQTIGTLAISLRRDIFVAKGPFTLDNSSSLGWLVPSYVSIDATGIAALQPAFQCPLLGFGIPEAQNKFALGAFDFAGAGLTAPTWLRYNVMPYGKLTSGNFVDPKFSYTTVELQDGSDSLHSTFYSDNGSQNRFLMFGGFDLYLAFINYQFNTLTTTWIGVPTFDIEITCYDAVGATISTITPLTALSMTLLTAGATNWCGLCADVDFSAVSFPSGTRAFNIYLRCTNYPTLDSAFVRTNCGFRKLNRRVPAYPSVGLDSLVPIPGILIEL